LGAEMGRAISCTPYATLDGVGGGSSLGAC